MQHVQHGAASPAASSAAPADHRGVCIVNSDSEGSVDAAEVARLGYKLRVSPSCLPAMLVTGRGCTIAFMLLDGSQSSTQTGGDDIWDRSVYHVCLLHCRCMVDACGVTAAKSREAFIDDGLVMRQDRQGSQQGLSQQLRGAAELSARRIQQRTVTQVLAGHMQVRGADACHGCWPFCRYHASILQHGEGLSTGCLAVIITRILDLIYSHCRYQGKPAFVHAPPGSSFTQVALAVSIALYNEKFNSLFEQASRNTASGSLM